MTRDPLTAVLPFKVQCLRERKQHNTAYVTDSTHAAFSDAVAAGTKLFTQYDRTVRIVDQNHVEFARIPPRKPSGHHARKAKQEPKS